MRLQRFSKKFPKFSLQNQNNQVFTPIRFAYIHPGLNVHWPDLPRKNTKLESKTIRTFLGLRDEFDDLTEAEAEAEEKLQSQIAHKSNRNSERKRPTSDQDQQTNNKLQKTGSSSSHSEITGSSTTEPDSRGSDAYISK